MIWPIQFSAADNDLDKLYDALKKSALKTKSFLNGKGISLEEVTLSAPVITDKSAQQYGGNMKPEFRYTAFQTITVYSNDIAAARTVMGSLSELGKQGIVLSGDNYKSPTEYMFTRLNEVKPEMIEEATRKAREVAEKFASHQKYSGSVYG